MKKNIFRVLFLLISSFGISSHLEATPTLTAATEFNNAKPLEKFSLIDTNGSPFSQASLLNQWTLVFFGYTTCLDVCPRTLTTVSNTWKLLPPTLTQHSLRFVFISLDPKTDTPPKLRAFLERFNPHFMGLTGSHEVIQTLSKSVGIFSYEDPNLTKMGTKMIDHSGALLLINPKGQVQALFSPPHQQEAIAKDLEVLIKNL